MIVVTNMTTGYEYLYINMTKEESLVAAYRASIGDYNTWDYPNSKHPPIELGQHFLFCGDFSTPSERSK